MWSSNLLYESILDVLLFIIQKLLPNEKLIIMTILGHHFPVHICEHIIHNAPYGLYYCSPFISIVYQIYVTRVSLLIFLVVTLVKEYWVRNLPKWSISIPKTQNVSVFLWFVEYLVHRYTYIPTGARWFFKVTVKYWNLTKS